MKRFAAFLLAAIVCVTFVACGNKNEESAPVNEDLYFDAEVLALYENSILVKPIGGKNAPSYQEVVVSTEIQGTNTLPAMEAGTKIRVMFGGEISETEPAQIKTVFAIYLLDAISE